MLKKGKGYLPPTTWFVLFVAEARDVRGKAEAVQRVNARPMVIATADHHFNCGRNVRRVAEQTAKLPGKLFMFFERAATRFIRKHQVDVRNKLAIRAKDLFLRSDFPAAPCVTLRGGKRETGRVDPGKKRAE